MLGKISKIFLVIWAILLLIILITFPSDFGFFLLLGTGVFTGVMAVFISRDVRNLNNGKGSKILTVILFNLVFYLSLLLIYSLGNIGSGDKGIMGAISILFWLILAVISIIIGVVLIIKNKKTTTEGSPNKILMVILAIVLLVLFYGAIINSLAILTNNPNICSANIELEINENSMIFMKGGIDRCLGKVARNSLTMDYCNEISDISKKDSCIRIIGLSRGEDASYCYKISDSGGGKRFCIKMLINQYNDVSLCNGFSMTSEEKDDCYKTYATIPVVLRSSGVSDSSICENIMNLDTKEDCYFLINK